jgi:NTP pyrophosphatase (non-canonical NTP hydrolase)
MTYTKREIERRDRTNVEWFGELMRLKLWQNEDKPGWLDADLITLVDRIRDEIIELAEAMKELEANPTDMAATQALLELADVGNTVMMVASWIAVHHQGQERLR